ncbi:ATP:cob(I)alamin adenosyltransferase [cyanobacterium TDX16]|nr:ATP:cob(I)alamin adenosyltransferase [cyanobacterium TDX16]
MKVYTRKGDDGTTGLLYGGRVPKASPRPAAYGDVDEAQAFLGVARSKAEPGGELDRILVELAHDLWVLMAELATDAANQHKLVDGQSRVTAEMVERLERHIDDVSTRFDPPTEFVTPGQTPLAADLDVARTVARRAERSASLVDGEAGSQVGPYLNRLSDLLWTLARWQEGEHLITKTTEET